MDSWKPIPIKSPTSIYFVEDSRWEHQSRKQLPLWHLNIPVWYIQTLLWHCWFYPFNYVHQHCAKHRTASTYLAFKLTTALKFSCASVIRGNSTSLAHTQATYSEFSNKHNVGIGNKNVLIGLCCRGLGIYMKNWFRYSSFYLVVKAKTTLKNQSYNLHTFSA